MASTSIAAARKKYEFTVPVTLSRYGNMTELAKEPSEPVMFMAPDKVPVYSRPTSAQVVQRVARAKQPMNVWGVCVKQGAGKWLTLACEWTLQPDMN